MATSPVRAQSGGIEVFAAETLFEEGLRLSSSYLFHRKSSLLRGSKEINDPLDRTEEEHRYVAGIDYGLLPDLTLSALLPVVYTHFETRTPGGQTVAEPWGLGDTALLAKYRVYKLDWPRSTFNVSVIGGLELPTGTTGEEEDGVRLPPTLQPGSGSFDPIGAVAANLSLNRFRFDGLLLYKANTEGSRDYAIGDFFAAQFDAKYRYYHAPYPGPTASVKVGVQFRHESDAKQDGRGVPNTGSDEVRFRAGLGFHPTPGSDVSLTAEVPIYQDAVGQQLMLDVRVVLAVGIRF